MEEKNKKTKKIKSVKYKTASVKVDKNKLYTVSEAIKLVKETSYSKFVGSLEMHAIVNKTGITAEIELVHGTGKEKTIR